MASDTYHKEEFFQCECHTREHMVVVNIYGWDSDDPDFIMAVTADHHLPWYRRIWPAIRYVFGQPSLRWHDIIIRPSDIHRLQGCIDAYHLCIREAQSRIDKALVNERDSANER